MTQEQQDTQTQDTVAANGAHDVTVQQLEALRPALSRASGKVRAAFARERLYAGKRRFNAIADLLEQRTLEAAQDKTFDPFRLANMVATVLKVREHKARARETKHKRSQEAKGKLEALQRNAKGSLSAETLAEIEQATKLL